MPWRTGAKACEQAGAELIAVHARTREQMYTPGIDPDIIAKVKAAVKVPVLGNGDIHTAEDAVEMMQHTGCDGVMIGRAARGNPWLFHRVAEYLETGKLLDKPSGKEIKAMMLRHARMQVACKGDYTGIREMRKHISWYTTGLPGSAKLRGKINSVESLQEMEELLQEM